MASGLQLLEQVIATGIVRKAAGVRDGQQGDGEAHGTLAVGSDARTFSAGTANVLRVLLFASLRDRAGWSERMWTCGPDPITARQLWDQLALGSLEGISVAVNQQLVGADQELKAGDELAFLPPFTGG